MHKYGKPIYFLYGGESSERSRSVDHELPAFKDYLKDEKFIPVDWRWDGKFSVNGKVLSRKKFFDLVLATDGIVLNDVCGEKGEDGFIQTEMTLAGVTFTGSDSYSSMLSMDKFSSMQMVADIVDSPASYKTTLKDFDHAAFAQFFKNKYPVFVKPNAKGSSVGTALINNRSGLDQFLRQNDEGIYLFQTFVTGQEFSSGVVRDDDGRFLDLPITEIIPKYEYFSFSAKDEVGGAKEITPAEVDHELANKIKDISIRVHQRLGLGFYSRSDFIVTSDNKIYYLETNSLPGMGKMSILPRQLAYSGKMDAFPVRLLEHPVGKLTKKHFEHPLKLPTGKSKSKKAFKYLTGLRIDEICKKIEEGNICELYLKDGRTAIISGYDINKGIFNVTFKEGSLSKLSFKIIEDLSTYTGISYPLK